MATYQGRISHGGSQVIEAAQPRKGGQKPQVRKGGDLRAGGEGARSGK